MTRRDILLALSAAVVFGLLAWLLLARGFAGLGRPLDVRPEILDALEASRADQRTLAELRPEAAAEHRERFDELGRTLNRLRILELNRDNLARGLRLALLGVVGVVLVLGLGAHLLDRRALARRLARLQEGLIELSRGSASVTLGDRRRDPVGRVARMIEDTSRRVGADRRRLEQLEHLAAWQEGARRIAHELRTPLASAGLALRSVDDRAPRGDRELRRAVEDLERELRRIGDFVDRFTSFARLPEPVLQPTPLPTFVERFAHAHRDAWPGLSLRCADPAAAVTASIDPDLVRQVLANLCANAAQAAGDDGAAATLSVRRDGDRAFLEITDDGPGIAPEIRSTLFTPYATTRRSAGGLGLGLPICRKILLDHGGDLELVSSVPGRRCSGCPCRSRRRRLPRRGMARALSELATLPRSPRPRAGRRAPPCRRLPRSASSPARAADERRPDPARRGRRAAARPHRAAPRGRGVRGRLALLRRGRARAARDHLGRPAAGRRAPRR